MSSTDSDAFGELPLAKVIPDKNLPADIFVKIGEKFIRFKPEGDALPSEKYNYFISKNVSHLFAQKDKVPLFFEWMVNTKKEVLDEMVKTVGPDNEEVVESYFEVKEKVVSTFSAPELTPENVQELQDEAAAFIERVSKYKSTISCLAKLTKFNMNLADHSLNVANLSIFLSIALGNNHQLVLENIYLGALYHDYGKAKVDIEVLSDPEHPQYEEMMKIHPEKAVEVINELKILPPQVLSIVKQHHEHFDGSGYPQQLKGAEIYKLARIVSIANGVENVLVEHKDDPNEMYNKAIEHLEKEAGSLYDPEMAQTCKEALRSIFS